MTGKAGTAAADRQAKKAPRLFPVRIPETRFQKKILSRVYTTGDREFLLGLYALAPDGARQRKDELSGLEVKHLAGLAKSIAANRGVVQRPKLIILAVIVAAAIVFNLLFKNVLLTRALVAGLEGIFGARAEVAGLDFRVLGGSIGLDRVSVADRDDPIRNLFELGRTELSIDVFRLIEGRVHVRNLECRDVTWGTVRTTSGALATAAEARSAEETARPGLVERAKQAGAGLLQAIDIPSLVDEQVASLGSPGKIAASNTRVSGLADTWTARIAKSRGQIEELSGSIEEIRQFDYSSVSSVKDAQKLLDAIARAGPAVQSIQKELTESSRALTADLASVEADRKAITASLAADAALLKSKLPLSAGDWKHLASSLGSRVLEHWLGSYYRYARRAKDAVSALVNGRRSASAKEKPLSRQGRTVHFPGSSTPAFLISNAAFSIGERTGLPGIEGALRDLTSDPDLLGRPVTLQASAVSGGRSLALAGAVDLRDGSRDGTSIRLDADNWPVRLEEGLEALSIGSLAGDAALGIDFALGSGGSATGGGSVSLRGIAVQMAALDDPLGASVAGILRSIPEANAQFTFSMTATEVSSIAMRTDLDELLFKKVGGEIGKLTDGYEVKIREELASRLAPELDRNADLSAALAALQESAGTDLATAASYGDALAKARAELEKRLKSTLPLPKLTF